MTTPPAPSVPPATPRANCLNCSAPLTPGANFCHRCGTPAGTAATPARNMAGAMPWAVAGLALVCLVALVVGQKFGARNNPAPDASQEQAAAAPVAPFAGGATGGPTGSGAPPDISQMSPAERAERLYDRIMREAEAGKIENVRTFMPMALAAYDALSPLNLDQRYDVGRIGEVAGDATIARAQADTILRQKPTHLLGLILAAKAERMGKNEAAAKGFDARLRAAEPSERASGLPEYLLHKTDIDAALAAAK